MRLARIHLWLLALAAAVAGLILLNQMFGVFFLRQLDVAMGISLLIAGYAILGLCCAAVHDNGRLRPLMRVGMIIGLAGATCWIVMIAMPEFFDVPMFVTATIALSVFAGAFALLGMLSLFPLRTNMHRGMRVAAIIALLLLAAFIVGAFAFAPGSPLAYGGGAGSTDWQRYFDYEQSAYRIGTGIVMLAGLLTAATLTVGVLDLLTARGKTSAHPPRAYWLQCPRCRLDQQAMTGEFHCAKCRLRTKVELV